MFDFFKGKEDAIAARKDELAREMDKVDLENQLKAIDSAIIDGDKSRLERVARPVRARVHAECVRRKANCEGCPFGVDGAHKIVGDEPICKLDEEFTTAYLAAVRFALKAEDSKRRAEHVEKTLAATRRMQELELEQCAKNMNAAFLKAKAQEDAERLDALIKELRKVEKGNGYEAAPVE